MFGECLKIVQCTSTTHPCKLSLQSNTAPFHHDYKWAGLGTGGGQV